MQSIIDNISVAINDLLAAHPDKFLVGVKIKPTNNIKVYIDGDNGVTINDIAGFNRKLYNQIEETKFFGEEDFSLEVSSPGIDEPLQFYRQYVKNLGKNVIVTFQDGQELEGNLILTTEQEITIEHIVKEGKKKVVQQTNIPFESIKTTVVQISFNRK